MAEEKATSEEEVETLGSVTIEIRDLLQNIFLALGGEEAAVEAAENMKWWEVERALVGVVGEPKQLPPQAIPTGYGVVVKAMHTNTGEIYVSNSKYNVKDPNRRAVFEKKDGTILQVDNTDLIWIDASVAGEGVEWWVEVKR